jgi:antitoxin ParD1/3/4
MNVSITLYYEEIIEQAIKSGVYANSSEVVRAGLRLLEKELGREAKIKDLRQAIQEGEDSGPSQPWNAGEVKREGRALFEARQRERQVTN